MRKTAVFATVMGLCAATTVAALATYQIVKLYAKQEKRKKEEEVLPQEAPLADVAGDAEELAENLEDIPQNGTENEAILLENEGNEEEIAVKAVDDAEKDICYYLPQSKIWHSDETCAFIVGKSGVVTATIAKANAAGKTRGCSRCGA